MNKFLKIIEENSKLEKNVSKKININILSNINVNFIEEIIKNHIMKSYLRPIIKFNNINETNQIKSLGKTNDVSIVFWEIFNILPSSIVEINRFKENKINTLISNIENEIDFLINRIGKNKAIFFNLFNNSYLKKNTKIYKKTSLVVNTLNKYLHSLKKKNKNLHLLELDNIFLKNYYDLGSFNTNSICFS